MARETLFEQQSVSGFMFADQYGMYAKAFVPAPFSLTAGEEYIVLWDDAEYTVTAMDISALFPGGVAVGNGSGFGMAGNNEPFIVASFATDVSLFVVDPTDARDTHSFGIYKEVDERVLFSEKILTGFAQDGGAEYVNTVFNAPEIVDGETYTIAWDGTEYEYTAGTADGIAYVGEMNCDPFAISCIPGEFIGTEGFVWYIATVSDKDSHTLGVYKGAAVPANIILRDRDGVEQEYPMRQMLEVDTTEGGTVLYSKGQTLESVPVELDFSAGNTQTITAPNGYLVKSAVIEKPATLVPENIAKDVDVAGVVGTHEGGGGGADDELYVFCCTAIGFAVQTNNASALTAVADVYIPPESELLDYRAMRNITTRSTSFDTAVNYPKTNKEQAYQATGTVIQQADSIVIRSVYIASYSTSSKYKCLTVESAATFRLPGVYEKREGNVKTIYATGNVSMPQNPISDGSVQKLDFSNYRNSMLPDYCFTDWRSIEEVVLSENVTTIGVEAFFRCTNLKKIEMPGVTSIGTNALRNCTALEIVDMSKATTIPALANNLAISANDGLQILVPAALYDQWIAATNWSSLASYIVAV